LHGKNNRIRSAFLIVMSEPFGGNVYAASGDITDVNPGFIPLSDRVDETNPFGALQHFNCDRFLAYFPLVEQPRPAGARKQTAFYGRGHPFTVVENNDIGDARFRYFFPVIPEENVITGRTTLPGVGIELSKRGLMVEKNIKATHGRWSDPEADGFLFWGELQWGRLACQSAVPTK